MSKSITTQTLFVGEVEIPVLEYRGQRVITFAMIDKVHQRPEGTARKRFHDNRHRFVEGKHFHLVDFSEKSVFRTFGIEIPPRGLIVLTQHGYLFIVKSFTDDLAWKIQETLIDTYFQVREIVTRSVIPYHLLRYLKNLPYIPAYHFSILTELTIRLFGSLEALGYTIPDNMLPDISEGKHFNQWLREKKGADTYPPLWYTHTFADGRQIKAKAYPNELWPDFMRHFYAEWLPKHAPTYFQERDPIALSYLPKLLENRRTQSLTDLLKARDTLLTTQKANKILLELGLLEEKTRPSVTKGTKNFKVLTEKGQVYGKNIINPRKPEESNPRYYVDTFDRLLELLESHLV